MLPTIDEATFRELQDTAGADFVSELVDTFLEEAPGILAELRAALADRNAVRFGRAAHSLKSNGATFGALALASLARDLELQGMGPEPGDAAVLAKLEALEAALGRAAEALKARPS